MNINLNTSERISVRKKIKYLHNIFISDARIDEQNLPFLVKKNINSLKIYHPDAEYIFWQEDEIRVFLRKNFTPNVLEAFDCLKAFALKADLARYCILYILGGLYSDLSNRFVSSLDLPSSIQVAAFKDRIPMHGAFWMVQNTIIYADAGSSELELAVNLSVRNIEKRDYGNSSLEPTGPALFGRVFAIKQNYLNYKIGSSVNIDVGNNQNRSHYVFDDGTLLAVRLQGGGGKPAEIGLKGTNVYGDLWDRRQLFDEDKFVYPFDSSKIHSKEKKESDGIRIKKNTKGYVIYGPYIPLFEGKYTAEMEFRNLKGHHFLSLDVCCLGGKKILAEQVKMFPDECGKIYLEFVLEEYVPDLEVRLKASPAFEGVFTSLNIFQRYVKKEEHKKKYSVVPNNKNSYVSKDVFYIHCFNFEVNKNSSMLFLKSIEEFYPYAFLEYWNENKIYSFIKTHFPEEIVGSYNKLLGTPFALDFAKYCVLYAKGGLCVEHDLQIIAPINLVPGKDILAFLKQDKGNHTALSIDTSYLFSRPEQPEINTLIGWLTEITKKEMAEISNIYKSGYQEAMLMKALAFHGRTKSYSAGQVVQITENSHSYIGEDGSIYAVRCLQKSNIAKSELGKINEDKKESLMNFSKIFEKIHNSVFNRNKSVKV